MNLAALLLNSRRARALLTLALVLAMGVSATGCGRKKRSQVIRDCVFNDDQRNSFKGQWRVTPVKVAFAPGFSAADMQAAVAAFKSWNNFAQASRGYPLLNFSDDGSTPRVVAASPPADWQATCRSTRLIQGSQFSGSVMLYRPGTWRYEANAIAVTSECHDSGTGGPNSFYNAQIEFNVTRYFASGSSGKIPDLESITLHEIGHVLGLDHSCESNSPQLPKCATAPAEYTEAVMFPEFRFDASGGGEQRRILKNNDQGRMNCLYEAAS